MKKVNAFLALLLMCPVLWAEPQRTIDKMGLSSQVCFVQPEISGRMNVEESEVSFSNDQHVTLMGGQAACLCVFPGTYVFRIEFLNSEGLFHRKSTSPKYDVSLRKGDRTVFEIYRATTKSGEYLGSWRARAIEQKTGKE